MTHYTGFSVTKALILDESKFRLSEGAYLNDTSEGRELFNFLPAFTISFSDINDTVAKLFAPKPFIGSFVAETKHDDLTLWRMYGKENKEEARGCAITFEREKLIESLKNSLIPPDKVTLSPNIEDEFNFYRVAYRQQLEQEYFIVPGVSAKIEKTLNDLMLDLKNKVNKYLKRVNISNKQDLLELLNGIAYLFKSAEYQYENELRLVVKGTGILKEINNDFNPPRVYVELMVMNSLIRKITLGPKVERSEEWASTFYYSMDKQGFKPDDFYFTFAI